MLSGLTPFGLRRLPFANRIAPYLNRVENALDAALPDASVAPTQLHAAMRYAVLDGGKRIRPLLVYAAGEALRVAPELLDPGAVAIELMHAFSLIHDDLPAMDDDDFRHGKPATHRAFGEATAILAADAMQPLAFRVLATAPALLPYPEAQTQLVALLAEACGPNGISSGQALDLAAESRDLDPAELEHMYRLKTGRLLRAGTLVAAFCPPGATRPQLHALERFADALGVAYQIRDDMLDVTAPDKIGAKPGSDLIKGKATYAGLYGMDRAGARADELLAAALQAIEPLGAEADGLRDMARYAVLRED